MQNVFNKNHAGFSLKKVMFVHLLVKRNQIQSSYWKIRWSMYHMTEQIVHGKCLILGINDSFVKRIPLRACDEVRN